MTIPISHSAFSAGYQLYGIYAAQCSNRLSYTYGADYERIKGVTINKQNNSVLNTRYYFGGYEKDITGAVTKYIQYVSSPVGLIAIVTSEGATHTPHFVYTDHLGSILTVTNGAGTVEAEQSFDAWGRRRDPGTWALLPPTAATALPDWLYRGYTGHEHLDHFGLINMNGRMYDPVVGRMLSADNYIQEPGMTQSYNRYTYAMNNPMVNTDPNGQFWNFVVGGIIGGFSGYKIGKASGAHGWGLLGFTLGGAALGAFTAGVGEGAIASFGVAGSGVTSASIGAYAAAGAITGAVSGASFAALAGGGAGDLGKAALWGGAIGGATGALGGYLKHAQFENSISNSDRYLADCPKCAAMFPKETGIWLDEANVYNRPINSLTGLPLATGAITPNYFIEDWVVGGKILQGGLKLGGMAWGAIRGLAAKGVTNTVTRSESVLGHIFRDAVGHVNPSTITSQNRYISLFENVANNSANINPNVLTNFQRTAGGFQGYSQIFRNGSQVWTQTFNGKIINAGVNVIPR